MYVILIRGGGGNYGRRILYNTDMMPAVSIRGHEVKKLDQLSTPGDRMDRHETSALLVRAHVASFKS